MKTIKVIKTGATAVETRKKLRNKTNKVEVESRPNVGPELLELVEGYKHLMRHKADFVTDGDIARKLGIFESQVKLLKRLMGYEHEKAKKAKEERFKRRTELQDVR